MRHAIGKLDLTVTGKAVEHEGKSLFPLNTDRSLEVFIEHGADEVARGRDKTCDRNFIRQLTTDQSGIVGEIDIDLYVQRCAGGGGRECGTRSAARS